MWFGHDVLCPEEGVVMKPTQIRGEIGLYMFFLGLARNLCDQHRASCVHKERLFTEELDQCHITACEKQG
ncbi:unnamed protein product [Merluccius merluccius]